MARYVKCNIAKAKAVGFKLDSSENICKIVNRNFVELWENEWISSNDLKSILDVKQIVISDPEEVPEVILPEEVEIFSKNACLY